MAYKYSFNKTNENMSKAVGLDLGISAKKSIEVCNLIRGRKLPQAKRMLEDAISLKRAIPFTRFMGGAGHKSGMGSGKYAVETCKSILLILKSAEANAENKGLNQNNLIIRHISAQKAARPFRNSRKRRQKMKRTHIEVVLEEVKSESKSKEKKVEPKKETKK